jgi:hypothetical protein
MVENTLERYERRKQEQQDKQKPPTAGLQVKDYFTLGLSILALTLSAATAYFTVLKVTENIEATAIDFPTLQVTKEKTVSWAKTLDLTFVNNGTLPIAVADATLILIFDQRPPGQEKDDDDLCSGNHWLELQTDAEPFVVKPAEIIIKKLGAASGQNISPTPENFKGDQPGKVHGCVQLRLVTARGGEFATEYFGSWTINDPDMEGIPTSELPTMVRRLPLAFLDRSRIRLFKPD